MDGAGAILGIGTDLLDVARVAREIDEGGSRFRDSVFTPGEIAYCEGKRYPARHFAARFAAKEAFVKALGRSAETLRDIEVTAGGDAPPELCLHGDVRRVAESLGVKHLFVSLTHTRGMASATVILQG